MGSENITLLLSKNKNKVYEKIFPKYMLQYKVKWKKTGWEIFDFKTNKKIWYWIISFRSKEYYKIVK